MSFKKMPKKENKSLDALLVGKGLPKFSEITPDNIEIQIPQLLSKLSIELTKLERALESKFSTGQKLYWEDVIDPLEAINENLRWSWGVVSHLNAVCNSKELRAVHTAKQPEVIRFSNRLGQSKIIYKALENLNKNNSKLLNQTEKRILQSELLSMKNKGIGLNRTQQLEFNANSEKLAEHSTNFSNNLLDATKKWSLLLTKPSDIDGLPARALEVLAQSAKEAGDLSKDGNLPTPKEGPWRLRLDMPIYMPFITYAKNRSLREKLYKANISKASKEDSNNQPLINEILSLREKQANLLGYKNWAELSLSEKMAENIDAVEELIEELRTAALPAAKRELSELNAFAEKNTDGPFSEISAWDLNYWSEQLRQHKFDLDQEALRPWFPLPKVLKGLFDLCNRLFDISIVLDESEDIPIWHKDVQFFRVKNQDGEDIAAFYLDLYSRPKTKRSGAWMDECLIRSKSKDGEIILPVAYLICNQTPPLGNAPSLMSFDEVETLFHEFGHGLQHMLTSIDYPKAAGINNIEWDAVELPSQFMENWCLERGTLLGMARHWKTNEPLPEKEFKKLVQNRKFNSGLSTLRQIHFALTDLKLHSVWNRTLGETPDELRREIAKYTTVMPPIKEDQFLCSFSHIFAGGYAAGYYSYKWAEVLSSDAFSAFEEIGLENSESIKAKGIHFKKTVLSLGGSISPAEVFELFRGRPPHTEALIRHSGFSNEVAN